MSKYLIINYLKYYKTILAVFIILFLSIMSTDNIKPDSWRIFPWEDKLAHYIIYTFLSFILFLDFNGKNNTSYSRTILLLTIGIAYGGLMELIQKFVPGRSADFIDFLFDAAGVITGMLLYLIWKKIRY